MLTRRYRRRPLDALESPLLRRFLSVWKAHCGSRKYPARDDLRPRDLAPILPHLTLARVVDGGRDLELRIIGDEIVQSYGENFTGRRLSSISPFIGPEMEEAYHAVLREAEPVLLEGWFEIAAERCFHREVLVTPLGESGQCVDHVLSAGALSSYQIAKLSMGIAESGAEIRGILSAAE